MNDLLKLTLEDRAADVSGPHLDVAGLEAAGRRRVRRRRLAGGAGVLALVAVLGVATPYVVDRTGEDPGQVATDTGPFGEPAVSWVAGRTLHVGETTIELEQTPVTYVLTDAGAVYVDDAGTVRLDDGETTERIGTTTRSYGRVLVGGGSYAAWYDVTAGEFVAHDVVAGREVLRQPAVDRDEEFQAPTVVDLDGTSLYLYAERRVTETDLTNGISTDRAAVDSSYDAQSAADGQLALAQGQRTVIGGPDTTRNGSVPGGGRADLSPDASYVATDADDSELVYDVTSGEDVTPELGNYGFQAVVQWLSDDTYQALAFSRESLRSGNAGDLAPDMLVCSVADDACETVARDVSSFSDLQLPVGEPLD